MKTLRPIRLSFLACVIAVFAFACQPADPSRADTTADAQSDTPTLPDVVEITDDTENVLFSFGHGAQRGQASSVADVPEEFRSMVRATPLTHRQNRRISTQHILVYDLRQAGADGTYPGRVITRSEFESHLASARKKRQKQPIVESNSRGDDQNKTGISPVIMYSTSWCGYCRKARQFMERKKIAFIEKDIEKDTAAAQELAQKKSAAGQRGGGVPVFDIGGQLVQGFDKSALLRLAKGTP